MNKYKSLEKVKTKKKLELDQDFLLKPGTKPKTALNKVKKKLR